MKHSLIFALLLSSALSFSQTKVGGIVKDVNGDPVAFANILFLNSTEGTITNDDGRFYMESDSDYDSLQVSFVGYQTAEISLTGRVNYNMEIILQEGGQLDEVVVYVGKQSKKNNPAVDILRKIWAKKRINGLRMFKQYQFDKYEKIEFDLNTIDSAMMPK